MKARHRIIQNEESTYVVFLSTMPDLATLKRVAAVSEDGYAARMIEGIHQGLSSAFEFKSDFSKYFADEYVTPQEYLKGVHSLRREICAEIQAHWDDYAIILSYDPGGYWFIRNEYGMKVLRCILKGSVLRGN